jgi:hypothetical protein
MSGYRGVFPTTGVRNDPDTCEIILPTFWSIHFEILGRPGTRIVDPNHERVLSRSGVEYQILYPIQHLCGWGVRVLEPSMDR